MQSHALDQVRVSSGVTFGPGCVCPVSLRLNWGLMCAAMRVCNTSLSRRKPARPITPHPADYALPADLDGTRAGRVYAALLACADTDGVLPPNDVLVEMACLSANNDVPPLLDLLLEHGFLDSLERAGKRRTLRIAATGQVLRSAGYSEQDR